jgi:N-acyl-D-amino-acid deacylase
MARSFAEAQRSHYAAQLKPLDGAIDGDWTWRSVAEFLVWQRGRSVTDMGIYLGHSAVRRVVMNNLARVATDAEIAAMAEVVHREAPLTLGLSTGIVYNPAVYCDQSEITALVRAFDQVKPGALFPHLRSESGNIIASIRDVVEAAVDGGGYWRSAQAYGLADSDAAVRRSAREGRDHKPLGRSSVITPPGLPPRS